MWPRRATSDVETSTKDPINNHSDNKAFVVVLSCPIVSGGKNQMCVCVCTRVCVHSAHVHVHVWIVQEDVNSKKAYVKL